jgi:hypothetical protein
MAARVARKGRRISPGLRSGWRTAFFTGGKRLYPCPRCRDGHLDIAPSTLKHLETADSRVDDEQPGRELGWGSHRFSGLLVCDKQHGREVVTVAGHVDFEVVSDEDGDPVVDRPRFKPTYMNPAPRIFRAPGWCSAAIVKELDAAFSAFWCDADACANRIRRVVELVLSHSG